MQGNAEAGDGVVVTASARERVALAVGIEQPELAVRVRWPCRSVLYEVQASELRPLGCGAEDVCDGPVGVGTSDVHEIRAVGQVATGCVVHEGVDVAPGTSRKETGLL